MLLEFEVSTVSIVSPALPERRKNTRPSGTLMANSPVPREAVVGTEPVAKLLKCMIFAGICYKYSVVGELLLLYGIFFKNVYIVIKMCHIYEFYSPNLDLSSL